MLSSKYRNPFLSLSYSGLPMERLVAPAALVPSGVSADLKLACLHDRRSSSSARSAWTLPSPLLHHLLQTASPGSFRSQHSSDFQRENVLAGARVLSLRRVGQRPLLWTCLHTSKDLHTEDSQQMSIPPLTRSWQHPQ